MVTAIALPALSYRRAKNYLIYVYCFNSKARTIEQGHRGAVSKKSEIGKFKKLTAMLQKRLKTDKNRTLFLEKLGSGEDQLLAVGTTHVINQKTVKRLEFYGFFQGFY